MNAKPQRLDAFLVERGLIMAGIVRSDGEVAPKSGVRLSSSKPLTVHPAESA
ncbi:MAG: hypothetical protein ACR2N0_14870 [Rubrobacteraceae bacterium]|jgi:hypothetical protein